MKENPCFKCTDRQVGCHARCDRYQSWNEERLALKEKADKERVKEMKLQEEPFRAIERTNKERRRK